MSNVIVFVLMSLFQKQNLNAKHGNFDFHITSVKDVSNSVKLSTETGCISILM